MPEVKGSSSASDPDSPSDPVSDALASFAVFDLDLLFGLPFVFDLMTVLVVETPDGASWAMQALTAKMLRAIDRNTRSSEFDEGMSHP